MKNHINPDWPPPYTLRISQKIKSLQLQISHRGLEIVIPKRCSQKTALAFLNQKRSWVEKNLASILIKRPPVIHPSYLELSALAERWQISYLPSKHTSRVKLISNKNHLLLSGNVDPLENCISTLEKWLKQYAKPYLIKWMNDFSQRCGLSFNKISIRGQLSRWGSCSKQKNINLNYKLLFLPKKLVDYILIHELCHTVHLNHSKRFWRLVSAHCPDYMQLRKELREAEKLLPEWLKELI